MMEENELRNETTEQTENSQEQEIVEDCSLYQPIN